MKYELTLWGILIIWIILCSYGYLDFIPYIKEQRDIIKCSPIWIKANYYTTEEDSIKTIDYLNTLRMRYGKKPIKFDKRVYDLAMARAKDMDENNYLDHTNQETGACPHNMKADYGLKHNEYVAENALGNGYTEDQLNCTRIRMYDMTDAIDGWMDSRGHRFNLMYSNHTAGAVACSDDVCVFLGLNEDQFGKGCYNAFAGKMFWSKAAKQPGEV